MHPIRKSILSKLIVNESQKYSDLKPVELDPKLFTYHLNALITEELVIKNAEGLYQLTVSGRLFAEKLSASTLQPRSQPKLATMIICQNNDGEYLCYERAIEPLKGRIGFPWGKVHLGESMKEAAARELLERAQIKTELKHVGVISIILEQNNDLVSHTLYHLFRGTNVEKKVQDKKAFWEKIADPSNSSYLLWTADIIKLLKEEEENQFFYQEFRYSVS